MAETFTKLAQITLGADYANVNFTSISQNYTHLVLIGSGRMDTASYYANAYIKLNNVSTNYYGVVMEGTNGSPTVFNDSTPSGVRVDFPSGGTTSSNQFGVLEVWFHNYTSGSHKGGVAEMYIGNQASNSTFIDRRAWHWSNTSAISSLYIAAGSGKFKANSTFTLYGIGQYGSTNTGTASVAAS